MKIIFDKLLSYEEEIVEYDSIDEYHADVQRRKTEGWIRDKRPNWHDSNWEIVKKFRHGKDGEHIIQRYKRFGALQT